MRLFSMAKILILLIPKDISNFGTLALNIVLL